MDYNPAFDTWVFFPLLAVHWFLRERELYSSTLCSSRWENVNQNSRKPFKRNSCSAIQRSLNRKSFTAAADQLERETDERGGSGNRWTKIMCTELRLFTEWEEFTLTWFFYLGCCCRKKKGTELGFLDLCYYIYFVAFFVPFFFFPPFFFVVLDDLTVDSWQVGWQRTGDFLKLLELEALTAVGLYIVSLLPLSSFLFPVYYTALPVMKLSWDIVIPDWQRCCHFHLFLLRSTKAKPLHSFPSNG